MACALIGCNQALTRIAAQRSPSAPIPLRSPPPRRRPPPRATPRARSTAEHHHHQHQPGGEDQQPRHVLLTPQFLPCAADLRAVFDQRFEDPRETHSERFMWDYWHVPQQYTLVRTPAHLFFPEALYGELEEALLEYGQQVLGCRSLTHVWLSYYVHGMGQELHGDVPHGPWAFVLSLTHWDTRRFEGGETTIMRPQVADLWRSLDASMGMEYDDVMLTVPPLFNQLTVFDPRLPHGVRRVHGTSDPRYGRLVVHGWFAEPAPFFTGALQAEEAAETLDAALDILYERLDALGPALGTVTARVHVAAEGAVEGVKLLTDTLVAHPSNEDCGAVRQAILSVIVRSLQDAAFPAAAADSFITVPFVFQ